MNKDLAKNTRNYWSEVADSAQMAQQVAQDLYHRFPQARAELYTHAAGWQQGQSTQGTIREVLGRLQQHCAQYSKAKVRYQPDHPYGMVLIVKYGELPVGRSPQGQEGSRPRAVLTLLHNGQRDVLIGKRAGPLAKAQ